MGKEKLYMIVCMVVLAVSIIGSVGTYAWYTWSTDNENETKIVTNLGAATVFYNAGSNITDASLKPVATKEEGIVKAITVSTDRETTYKVSFNLYLDIITLDEGLKDVSFKYALYKDGTESPIKEGNFSQTYLDSNLVECETNSTNHIVLISEEVVTTTELKYTLYIWIDGTMDNPNTMQSQNFNFKLHADGQNAVLGETLVQKITNLYEGADKTEVTNNSITYNYATSANLMNDRLGDSEVGIDSGNIRYYGANPNNYIDIGDVYTEGTEINNLEKFALIFAEMGVTDQDSCYSFFNCTTGYANLGFEDEASCTAEMPTMLETMFKTTTVDGVCGTTIVEAGTPILYRIIGLFQDVEKTDGTTEDLIKIIREDQLGTFAWDLTYDASTGDAALVNNWATSTLNSVLNDGYYNSTSAVHSYLDYMATVSSGVETISTVTTDFAVKGLNSAARSKTAKVKWHLGGWNTSDVYSNQVYSYERGTTLCPNCTEQTWSGKIALMYPSDYGYATDLSKCSSTLLNYETSGCYDNDWIYDGYTVEWMLTPHSDYSVGAWFVALDGIVYSDLYRVTHGIGVRPVFYLDSGLAIVSGDGSETSPYVVR